MTDDQLSCTVVSYVPFEITEEKPGLVPGRYVIPASDGEEPQVLVIHKALHYVYLDETRGSLQVRDSPDEVARSIVNDYITSQLRVSEIAKPGLFWVPGARSVPETKVLHKDLCDQTKVLQKGWLTEICKLADDDWSRYHQHNVVSDFQRKAGQMIGWTREQHEWMGPRTTLTSTFCPSCAQLVPLNAVVCVNCKCVINAEKYKELQFAGQA